jgi:SsrA-binding protein
MSENIKSIAKNKKAWHEYSIIESYEAGIVLTGTEVKSIRQGNLNMKDCYAKIDNGELLLEGMHVSPYEKGNIFNVDPMRTRKLLMHRYEIRKLESRIKQDGLTLIPLSIYFKKGKMKVELGLAKGKKLYDKREDTAKKEAIRRIDRYIKKDI